MGCLSPVRYLNGRVMFDSFRRIGRGDVMTPPPEKHAGAFKVGEFCVHSFKHEQLL